MPDRLDPSQFDPQTYRPAPQRGTFAPYQFDPSTYGTPDSTMTAYQPTWRDRIAQALMGDERPSDWHRRMVSEAVGSTGSGNTGLSALDAAPAVAGALAAPVVGPMAALGTAGMASIPGDILASQEAHQAGDNPTAAAYGIGAALPFTGKIAQGAKFIAKAHPEDYARMIRTLIHGQ